MSKALLQELSGDDIAGFFRSAISFKSIAAAFFGAKVISSLRAKNTVARPAVATFIDKALLGGDASSIDLRKLRKNLVRKFQLSSAEANDAIRIYAVNKD